MQVFKDAEGREFAIGINDYGTYQLRFIDQVNPNRQLIDWTELVNSGLTQMSYSVR